MHNNQDLLLFRLFVLFASTMLLAHGSPVDYLKETPRGTIKTIETNDGALVDCVDIYKQPAFEHPSLKNHVLQMKPNNAPIIHPNDAMLSKISQPWSCPQGSVPIRRLVKTSVPFVKGNWRMTQSASVNNGHQYSIIKYFDQKGEIKGQHATINVWQPSLSSNSGDFSLTQIWLAAYHGSNLETIEVGWQVYPGRLGDDKPTLFVYSTTDGYKTGCYDLNPACKGYVQISNQYSPGTLAFQPSVYSGKQDEVVLQVEKDKKTGNWWLHVNGIGIGYWPSTIFKALSQGASRLDWGGEIYDSSGSGGFHTLTQMGSGHFADEGYRKASYVRNLTYLDKSFKTVSLSEGDLKPNAPALNCYNYSFQAGADYRLWFYYGGPGCK
ncbi:neprosin-like protein [Drosera capensis]